MRKQKESVHAASPFSTGYDFGPDSQPNILDEIAKCFCKRALQHSPVKRKDFYGATQTSICRKHVYNEKTKKHV